jgi:long-chain acyl-CoA synthetase
MFDPKKPPLTLAELAQRAFVTHATRPALGTKSKADNAYHYVTYADVAQRVRLATGGLLALGLERGERAAILAENCAEWAIADLSCQMMGAISVPLFSTLPAVQVKGILQDCGASLVFVSDAKQLKKICDIKDELPALRIVVVMEAPDEYSEAASALPSLQSFAQLETLGETHLAQNATMYEATWPAAVADDVATIIYTSGTTGDPKGAMLTHRNIITNVEDLNKALHDAFGQMNEDVFLSFLPLAHVYERTAGFYLPLRMGAAIAYSESLFTLDKNLREARPTLMLCVPRLYESLRDKLQSAATSLPENQRGKYLDALQLAQKSGAAQGHLNGAPGLGLIENLKLRIYDAKVYSKIRERFGGRLKAFISGGAPMSAELGALFLGAGLNILEGYGLTETSPVIAVNRPRRVRLGTVGEPVDSVTIKIAHDGEILVRGASIMKGYWNKPEATAEAIDKEGWFHTGDIGEFKDNYLKITDRKKDLLVLANGKKVAPAPIEMKLSESPLIAQVVLLGDHQKGVVALLVPDMKALHEYSKKENLGTMREEELVQLPAINKLMRAEVERLTAHLADFEKVKKIALVPQPFSVEGGELTPTLKIKRKVVAEKYASLLGDGA